MARNTAPSGSAGPGQPERPARTHAVGIDLGTSNSALAAASPEGCAALGITQVLGPGRVGEKRTFASALYLPVTGQFPPDSLRPPWKEAEPPWVAGDFARDAGAQAPDRLVASAKSWLSYRSVDPTRPILPWGSAEEARKVSPLEASRLYLDHLREAYRAEADRRAAGAAPTDASGPSRLPPLEEAQVVLTVPASFDEVARKLTAQAARDAGLGSDVILLEEPQAAFYAWLDAVGSAWREQIRPGDLVLVCDVGGGTSDFSLIAVSEKAGNLELERIAVGRHILLGGDNMDLALAFTLRGRLEEEGKELDDWQFLALVQACRAAKESLFERPDLAEASISIPSRGSGLFAGTVSAALPRSLLEGVIVEGFFALTRPDEMPAEPKGAGLRELGLPYEADAVLSKHLAAFLARSLANVKAGGALGALVSAGGREDRLKGPHLRPDAILFNGGVFRSRRLRDRVLEIFAAWDKARPVRELTGADPDLAVARGAAAYGLSKLTGKGTRIRAGASRSYYIGLDSAMPAIPGYKPPVKALCVVPQGMEEGTEEVLRDREFGLWTGTTVTFRFFSAASRPGDAVGAVIKDAEKELEETSRLEMTLPVVEGLGDSTMVPVQLHARLSELGTLELWMQRKDAPDRWELNFDVRTG
jgi:molecular chaperone DnaK (HSP70)